MRLNRIVIRNIKCFSHLEINFADGKEIRRWTTLFGKNGLGKSTLLQAMGVALAGPSAVRELLPIPEGWVRRGEPYGEILAELSWTEGDALITPGRKRYKPYIARYIVTGDDFDRLPKSFVDESYQTTPTIAPWSGDGKSKERENLTKNMKLLQQTAYAEGQSGWLGCGYGPFRRLSGGSQDADRILYAERKSARFVTLFREDAALTSATKWLTDLYNTARDGEASSSHALEKVKEAFATNLFPEATRLDVNARDALLQIANQKPVPLQDLSDGYRSMMALSVDLLRWQIRAFPNEKNPMHCPGVVLIDELDAHMHPKWQRNIGHWLLEKFPNIQFIIATHSPFLAQVDDMLPMTEDNSEKHHPGRNIELEQTDEGVKARYNRESMQDMRADQILRSTLFDMDTLYSPRTEEKLSRHQHLHHKKQVEKLSPSEEREYNQLRLWREDMPLLSDPVERHQEQSLKKALQRFSEQLEEIV